MNTTLIILFNIVIIFFSTIFGFFLGKISFLYIVRKISKKTNELIDALDSSDPEFPQKSALIDGRMDVCNELLDLHRK